MARWTTAQVEAFAPDDKSIVAARKLARPGPWSDTGSTDTLLWGKCQGSGSTPYQVSVDLTGPAAKCTCPSRKFPCKHGLALLMMWSEGDGVITDADNAADFAADWAQRRTDRAARGSGTTDAPADPEAQAKRRAKRIELMSAALEDFERWLGDLYRQGAATARTRDYAFWDAAAARLVDGQAPALAERVRSIPTIFVRPDWADAYIMETGRWFLAASVWRRRDDISEADLANLRTYLGWPFSTEEVKANDRLVDRWVVEGVHRTEDGRIQAQRTWLRGQATGERIVVLDFAAVGGALGLAHVTGSIIESAAHRYPGSGIRRAVLADTTSSTDERGALDAPVPFGSIGSMWASELEANPFAMRLPLTVRGVFRFADGELNLVDPSGQAVALTAEREPWAMLASAGPGPVTVFGEFEDGRLRPVTMRAEDDRTVVPV